MKRIFTLSAIILFAALNAFSQQYTGMSGLIHVPSADMDSAGDARIGVHFLNHEFTPNHPVWHYDGKKYDTGDMYLSLTPFKWISIGYTMTLFKRHADPQFPKDKDGYTAKDRYFSIKIRPLEEGKWWPSVAIGSNDCLTSKPFKSNDVSGGNGYWRNYYGALTKHFSIKGNTIGVTAVYRHFISIYNHRWNGLVGGVTFRPAFARNLRAVVEWTGCDVNFGVDCLLWKHLLLQASLQDGRYPSGGICYVVNLF
ncbi:MAG: YjbH domain-containing protein [Firmicutes bacterium]|nr:YjbH domain-containing protein [Bacillota bacterium]MCM1401956.1 YjbH domain-containing protein [Bacteroides sp.]MCM1477902.1 YjbH domain-containing protein [Bacteroides sp.]